MQGVVEMWPDACFREIEKLILACFIVSFKGDTPESLDQKDFYLSYTEVKNHRRNSILYLSQTAE